jgi:outer membrane protein assembly factor BamB
MKLLSTKTVTILVTLFLTISISGALTILPTVFAQEVYDLPHGGTPDTTSIWSTTVPAGASVYATISPTAYLSFTPNPIGVGQTLLVNLWTTSPPAANRYLAGFKVTLTKPDGTKDTVGPLNSYVADGTAWFEYVVDQVGTWTLKFDFPGEYLPAGKYVNGILDNSSTARGNYYPAEYYNPASTPEQPLTVQSDIVISWQSPLPTDYWTRPISLNNRDWSAIAGNYPWFGQYMGSSMNGAPRWTGPFITSSNTAHMLWMRQDAFPAGIIGGEAGIYGNTGRGVTPDVIFEGRCYARQTVQWYNGSYLNCAVCYDLRTGEMYYMIPTAAPFYGISPTFIEYTKGTSSSVPGGGETNTVTASLRTLSGSQLYTINPQTGDITSNITCMSGVYHSGWVISGQTVNASLGEYQLINWTTAGTSNNFASRIVSNISSVLNPAYLFGSYQTYQYPENLDINNATMMSQPYYVTYQSDLDAGICVMQGRFVNGNVNGGRLIGYSLTTGQVIWNITTIETPFNPGTAVPDQGKYFCVMENGIIEAFDEYTGKLLWKTQTDYPWGEFWGYTQTSAYGLFMAFGYTGVYAFNWTTGDIVWHFSAQAPPFETPYTYNGTSVYSFTGTPVVADGKLYVENSEHTPSAPFTRGWGFYCINVTDGSQIWKVDEPMRAGAMADGYTTAGDSYNGFMYVFGKGQSATTVTAPDTVIPNGEVIVIKGAVFDQSAAQAGTPCVSEASMGAYMSYLHLQSPLPSDVAGVPVTLTAIDSTGGVIDIATVTTNGYYGTFGYAWAPPKEDTYTITASFAGTDAYGSSSAATTVAVGPALSTPTVPEIPTPVDNTMLLYGILVAVIIAIVLAIIAILIVLRKR